MLIAAQGNAGADGTTVVSWFEMSDLPNKLSGEAWVPLRVSDPMQERGDHDKLGYRSEFLGVATVMVPMQFRARIDEIEWESLWHGWPARPGTNAQGLYRRAVETDCGCDRLR